MTHRGKNDGFMQDAPAQRFDDEDEEETKRRLELSAINSKIAVINDRVGGMETKLNSIIDTLNGCLNTPGQLNRIEILEHHQEITDMRLSALEKHDDAKMDRIETKLDELLKRR